MIIVIICILLLLLVFHLLWLFTLNLLDVYFDNCSCWTQYCAVVMVVLLRVFVWWQQQRELKKRRKMRIWYRSKGWLSDDSIHWTDTCIARGENNTNYIYNLRPHALDSYIFLLCVFFEGFRRFSSTIEIHHRKSHSLHLITVRSHFMLTVSMLFLYHISRAVWFHNQIRVFFALRIFFWSRHFFLFKLISIIFEFWWKYVFFPFYLLFDYLKVIIKSHVQALNLRKKKRFASFNINSQFFPISAIKYSLNLNRELFIWQ